LNYDCGGLKSNGKPAPKKMVAALPPAYISLKMTREMDEEWEMLVFGKTSSNHVAQNGEQ